MKGTGKTVDAAAARSEQAADRTEAIANGLEAMLVRFKAFVIMCISSSINKQRLILFFPLVMSQFLSLSPLDMSFTQQL